MEEFNADFYATAAQTIALFFSLGIGSYFVLGRHVDKSVLPGVALMLIGYAVLMMYAEVVCLGALADRENLSRAQDSAVRLASYFSPGVLLGMILGANWKHVRRHLPDLKGWGGITGLGVLVLLLVASILGAYPEGAVATAIVIFLVACLGYGGWLMSRDLPEATEQPTRVSTQTSNRRRSSPPPRGLVVILGAIVLRAFWLLLHREARPKS